ncbi:hypothetical protein EDEG_02819 [Edhazardia aedis USNM 41457]|uniref:DUF4203 domain-containing protein n=1 Tax=Edhazardia aedis (strain USNM 41457) TaxID=1003232 RepID=J9D5G9_EDHAE|nr:hypothetical protein EDEG_02819 [Edhazardia aedis USNM 41457]|eukprot:EJW02779.1 hypothetical protein EDEG_02819 [Edhazardia aedis USNM 41457]
MKQVPTKSRITDCFVILLLLTLATAYELKIKWYVSSSFFLGYPVYIEMKYIGLGYIIYLVTLFIILAFNFAPFSFLDGVQECVIGGLGTYFVLCHLCGRITDVTTVILPTLFHFVCMILGIIVSVLCSNEKLSNLFLSLSAGYIMSVILCTLTGFKQAIIFSLTFVAFFIGFVFLKRLGENLHYCLIKAMTMGFTIVICADFVSPISILGAWFGQSNIITDKFGLIGHCIWAGFTIFLFFHNWFRKTIESLLGF